MKSQIKLLELYHTCGGARFRTVPATHDQPIGYDLDRRIIQVIDDREV